MEDSRGALCVKESSVQRSQRDLRVVRRQGILLGENRRNHLEEGGRARGRGVSLLLSQEPCEFDPEKHGPCSQVCLCAHVHALGSQPGTEESEGSAEGVWYLRMIRGGQRLRDTASGMLGAKRSPSHFSEPFA